LTTGAAELLLDVVDTPAGGEYTGGSTGAELLLEDVVETGRIMAIKLLLERVTGMTAEGEEYGFGSEGSAEGTAELLDELLAAALLLLGLEDAIVGLLGPIGGGCDEYTGREIEGLATTREELDDADVEKTGVGR